MRKLRLTVILVVVTAMLAGCVSNRWRTQEATAYYNAQQQLMQGRKPLFQLTAQPGQTITLSGVQSITVNDPREARVNPLPEHRSQALDTILGITKIAAQVYGIKVAADGAVDLADAVGRNAGDHSTTTITGSYNTQGDTLTNAIKGDVTGNGSGIGNTYSDGSVHGDGNGVGSNNNLQNGNQNRQNSGGPTTGGASNCNGGGGGSAGDTGNSGSGAGASGCTGGSAGG